MVEGQDGIQTDYTDSSGGIYPFIAEALVSAGPRKLFDEDNGADLSSADLCEDCAGLCWISSDKLVFWLSDGASERKVLKRLQPSEEDEKQPPVFGLSSRVLAKDLGHAFIERVCKKNPDQIAASLPEITASAFADIAPLWEERLASYLSVIEARGEREQFVDKLPKVGGSRRVKWYATFTAGIFQPREKTLTIVNYGNAGGLALAKSPSIIAPNSFPVAVFAWVQLEETLRANVEVSVSPDIKEDIFEDVDGFFVMSDGVFGSDTLMKINELKEATGQLSLLQLRTSLLASADLTYDDKAVVFGRFAQVK